MEQLRKRADRFRKQGRLQNQEMEEIIQDSKEETKQDPPATKKVRFAEEEDDEAE